METKDTALELGVLPPATNTEEDSIVQDLKNTENSSSESATLNPSVIKNEMSESMPTVDMEPDLDPDESSKLNPSAVTVDVGQDSDPRNSKCFPDQGTANIDFQLLCLYEYDYQILLDIEYHNHLHLFLLLHLSLIHI